MKPVLLDTGCIVALLDRSEHQHERCVAAVGAIQGPLVTCEAVIAESCYLLRKLRGANETVLENVQNAVFQIPFVLADQAGAVAKLLKKYADVPMDLADACLVDLATKAQTGRILTLDRDFKIYRWGKNRPFEFLLEME